MFSGFMTHIRPVGRQQQATDRRGEISRIEDRRLIERHELDRFRFPLFSVVPGTDSDTPRSTRTHPRTTRHTTTTPRLPATGDQVRTLESSPRADTYTHHRPEEPAPSPRTNRRGMEDRERHRKCQGRRKLKGCAMGSKAREHQG
jgi:hypothetical protein